MTQTTSSKTFFDIEIPESSGLYFVSPGATLEAAGEATVVTIGEMVSIAGCPGGMFPFAVIRRGGMTYLCQPRTFGGDRDSDASVLNQFKGTLSPETTVLVHGPTDSPDMYSRTGRKDFLLQNGISWNGPVEAGRMYPANRTYVGKCNGHQVVANFSKEVHG